VFVADGLSDRAVRLAQDASVVLDPGQQRSPRAPLAHDGLGRRQALGVLFEALDAEQLGQDRLLRRFQRERERRGGYSGPRAVCTATTSSMSTAPGSR
jgi:hypothetical protein